MITLKVSLAGGYTGNVGTLRFLQADPNPFMIDDVIDHIESANRHHPRLRLSVCGLVLTVYLKPDGQAGAPETIAEMDAQTPVAEIVANDEGSAVRLMYWLLDGCTAPAPHMPGIKPKPEYDTPALGARVSIERAPLRIDLRDGLDEDGEDLAPDEIESLNDCYDAAGVARWPGRCEAIDEISEGGLCDGDDPAAMPVEQIAAYLLLTRTDQNRSVPLISAAECALMIDSAPSA